MECVYVCHTTNVVRAQLRARIPNPTAPEGLHTRTPRPGEGGGAQTGWVHSSHVACCKAPAHVLALHGKIDSMMHQHTSCECVKSQTVQYRKRSTSRGCRVVGRELGYRARGMIPLRPLSGWPVSPLKRNWGAGRIFPPRCTSDRSQPRKNKSCLSLLSRLGDL